MQATEFRPYMESAVAEVLEAMCFISTEGNATDEEAQYQPDWICGRLEFEGVPSGTFGVAVPLGTASAIAANFLGEDEPALDNSQMIEVICEVTNMVCGTLLSHVESKKTFTLSAPRHDSTGVQNMLSSNRISGTFALDEGVIYTWLEIRGQA